MTVIELAGGVPALHPERKGQLNLSPLKNWVEKNGGLPTYINSFATAILRENPGWSISRVIATAVNMAKKVCATGRAFGGKVKVGPAVKAAACKAVAQWEAKKAKASMEFIDGLILASADGEIDSLELEKARRRAKRREESKDITESIELSDDMFINYAIVELSDDWGEGVNAEVDTDKWIEIMELSAAPELALRLPVVELGNAATATGNGTYRKEIWRVGDINYKGRKVRFTSDMLKQAYKNWLAKPFEYVPFQFLHQSNAGTDHPRDYAGRITSLSLDDEENPTKMIADFSLTEEAEKIVQHNPAFGVSVKVHPNFVHPSTGKYYGPTLLHVAGTHFPRLGEMGEWEAVKAGIDPDDETIDLSAGEFEGVTPDESVNDDKGKQEGGSMSEKKDDTTQEQTFDLATVMESDEFKAAIKLAVDSQTEDLRKRNEKLEGDLAEQRKEGYTATVKAAVNTYRGAGVKPIVLDYAEALMLSLDETQRNETIELSIGEGEEAKEVKYNPVQLLTKILDESKGTIDLGSERGSGEDEDEDASSEKAQDEAAMFLADLAHLEYETTES
jgi:hypothetical protein